MTSIRIERFLGMLPRLSDRLLPDTAASIAKNARLMSGELRGIKEPALLHEFATTVKSAFRLYDDDGSGSYIWVGFSSDDVDFVKGPLVNDAYDRYYYTGQDAFVSYNSYDRMDNGDPAYKLGTPAPTTAPALTVTGGSGDIETRVYCYTFVNEWGEESAPSPVVTASGYINGSWDLSSLETTHADMTGRNALSKRRIYRTVTGQASVDYFFVAELTMSGTTHSDTSSNATVVQNSILQSWGWDVPSTSLKGLVAHPSGFLVAFAGKNVYCSERYRPHAWPASYAISIDHVIKGLAIYNNMITVLTDGSPYFITGTSPSALSPVKSDAAEPCLSKTSIASTLMGVLYSSPNGLVLFNESGPNIVTNQVLTIEEWETYSPSTIKGVQYGQQYLAFYSTSKGFKYSPAEPFGVFSEIDAFDQIDNIQTDFKTGQAWLIKKNSVYRWEPTGGLPMYYTWKSKEFDFTRPINFGAYMVKMGNPQLQQQTSYVSLLQAYNAERIAYPLNPLNYTPINGKRTGGEDVGTTPAGIEDVLQNEFAINDSPIYNISDATIYQLAVTLKVYANGVHRYTVLAVPNTIGRLPSGFKAHVWQFELVGNDDVYSLAVAEVPKELMNV